MNIREAVAKFKTDEDCLTQQHQSDPRQARRPTANIPGAVYATPVERAASKPIVAPPPS